MYILAIETRKDPLSVLSALNHLYFDVHLSVKVFFIPKNAQLIHFRKKKKNFNVFCKWM